MPRSVSINWHAFDLKFTIVTATEFAVRMEMDPTRFRGMERKWLLVANFKAVHHIPLIVRKEASVRTL